VSEGGVGFGHRRRRGSSKLSRLWGKGVSYTLFYFNFYDGEAGRITGCGVTETVEEPEGPGALSLRTRDVVFTLATAIGHSRTREVGEDIAVTNDEGRCTRGRGRGLGVAGRSFL
jgi:hypothetical protein